MESELCDIGVKREEIEILDVRVGEEEDFEDNEIFLGFENIESDVKEQCFSKEIDTSEQDENITSESIGILRGGEGISGSRNTVSKQKKRSARNNPCNSLRTVNMARGKVQLKKKKIVTNSIKPFQAPSKKIKKSKFENIKTRKNLRNSTASKQNLILNKGNFESQDWSCITQKENSNPTESTNQYVCPYCDFQTCFLHVLAKHKRRHNVRLPWACTKCSYSSTVKYALQRHVAMIHERPPTVSCSECDFKCYKQSQLRNHSLVHSHQSYIQCPKCDYKHTKRGIMNRHMIKHLDDTVHLKCVLCCYRGVKPEYLKKHIEKHHKSELKLDPSFGLPDVDESSRNIRGYIANDIISYRDIIRKQPIVLLRRCDDIFKESNNIPVNMGFIHEQVLQDNFLDVAKCDDPEEIDNPEPLFPLYQEEDPSVVLKSTLITKNKNVITSLVKVVDESKQSQSDSNQSSSSHETEPKTIVLNEIVFNKINGGLSNPEEYHCKECSFVTMWFDRFQKHLKLHSSDCFYCDKCDFISKFRCSLARHKQLKHSQRKDYECDECDYKCSSSQYLKAHMRRHRRVRRFKCDQCRRKFKTAIDLKNHKRIHTEDRPFACDVCDFRTKYRESIKNHRFVHTGESKFVCNLCNEKFYANCLLKKHNMKVHALST